jgi:gluconolactonase
MDVAAIQTVSVSCGVRLIPLALATVALFAQEYSLGPDSQPQPGVPKGTVTQHSWTSQLFPGTVRDYWVYVPAQYKPDRPAPVMIFQDGGGFVNPDGRWRAPIVLDNLIHKGQVPVLIGIFINPGILPAPSSAQQPRFNRSFEYDALGDLYARFLIEEILPEVGKAYRISADPNDRALAGSSSGAIAAFNAAWNRPDAFRRVLSFIGSYTNLRGAQNLESVVRKMEPKPLRIFMQDGSNDQNIYGGDWFLANQTLYSALKYTGYEVTFEIGKSGHDNQHSASIFPDALRWLWQGYPKPIAKPPANGSRQLIGALLDPAKDWELVSEGHNLAEGPAIDKQGQVFFTDIRNNKIFKIGLDGKVTLFKEDSGGANGLMFGPDGRLYACQNGKRRVVAYTMDGAESVIADDVGSNDLAINSRGEIYFSDFNNKRVWFIDKSGAKRVVHEGITFPNGVLLSPDQWLLFVADWGDRWVWSFAVQPDGSLAHGERFYRLEAEDDLLRPDGMTVDTDGNLYVATRLGVQVLDQAGRVNAIIAKPQPGAITNVVFGGPDLNVLYATTSDKVYRRVIRAKGVHPWTPVMPPRPRL